MNQNSLIVTEQKVIDFYDDEIIAVRVNDGSIYVPLRPICKRLGLNWSAQRQRVNRDRVLSVEVVALEVTLIDHTRGSQQDVEMLSLPLKFLSGFLFGISVNRAKPELQERLIQYQRECYEVLYEAFRAGRLTQNEPLEALLETDSPAAQAYRMASAVMKIAQQQLFLESQIEAQNARLTDYEKRLESIEDQLGTPDRLVTPEQAMQISQAVRAVAYELGKRSGRNEYGGVYGELYRQYGINSYKALPANVFSEAMNWLNQWLQSLTDEVEF